LEVYSHRILRNLLAKLGFGRHADDEGYSAETTSKTARREQDRTDASHRKPPDDADSAPAAQTGDEPPADSKP
jgi:hypothetical protein